MSNIEQKPEHPNDNLKKTQQEQEQESVATFRSRSEIYSGPLPHPEILNRYDEIIPGAAERILKMAENEQGHRLTMDKESTTNAIVMGYLGITFAFFAVIMLVCLVYYALSKGFDTAAATISVGAIASVASVFIFFKKSGRRN